MLLLLLPLPRNKRRKKISFLKTDLEWVCVFYLTVSFYFGAFGEGRVEKGERRR
jgi:hypothetical protein